LTLIENEVKESLSLDYKECGALQRTDGKKNELSKDVSSFANSAGGTLVYGIIEDGHIPVGISEGYDPNGITKEWIEQVINSRIHQRIDGIIINQIELRKSRPGKVLYVVHIPQSLRAPHMAADKRFYKRYNFESVPMEEYEVRDVMNRSDSPEIRLICNFKDNEKISSVVYSTEDTYSAPIKLEVTVINDSMIPADYSSYKLLVRIQ